MSSRRTYFTLLIAASAALLVPFFVIEILPLQDYPNHLARIHILSHLENSPILQQYYQASWTLVPNLAMDVIVPLLAQLFSLEVAGAIFCALVLLSTAPAVSLLHYALHRKLSLWPLVCVLFAFNYVFIMGWLNYLLGVNLALIFAALWIKLRQWPVRRSLPLFTAFSTTLYFTHIYALGVYGLIVLGLEISHYSERRRGGVSSPERTWVAAVAQFFVPAVLFFAFSPTFHLNLTLVQAGNIIEKIAGIYLVLDTGHPDIDFITFGVMVAVLLTGTVLKSFTLDGRAAAPFWLLTTSFLLMPAVLFGGVAGYRLPIVIVWFLIAASNWRPGPRWRPKVGVALVSVLLAVRIGAIANEWQLYHEYQTEFLQAIESVPMGSTILPYVVAEDSYNSLVRPPKQHVASLAAIHRSAFVPILFADPGKQPLVLTEAYRALAKDKVRPDLPKAVFFRPMSNPAHPLQKNQVAGYDYVVLFAQDPGTVPVPPFLNEIETGTTFVLYRVNLSE